MAYTAITRQTLTDDDGSGTTGTVFNNALVGTAVYDKVDGLHSASRRETGPLVVENQQKVVLTNTTDTSSVTTEATLAWDTEAVDTGGLHEGVTNPSRITVPTGGDGLWLIGARVRFTSGSAATLRKAYIRKNGSTYIGESEVLQSTAALACTVSLTAFDPAAAATDYYEVRVASGTSVDVKGGTGQNTSAFWAVHLC